MSKPVTVFKLTMTHCDINLFIQTKNYLLVKTIYKHKDIAYI